VWSWRPDAGAKFSRTQFAKVAVAKEPGHRGERENKPLKPLRGECRVPHVTVVTNARAFCTTRAAAAGASGARHSLRPDLQKAESARVNLEQACRETAKVCPQMMPFEIDSGAGKRRPCAVPTIHRQPHAEWWARFHLRSSSYGRRFCPPARSRHKSDCHHPRRRATQYCRDADDRIERPRRTGSPACAGNDSWRCEGQRTMRLSLTPLAPPRGCGRRAWRGRARCRRA
jgi:hypothetical protein